MGVITDSPEVLIMQKSKSASSGGRLKPRKIWRSRSKSQSRGSVGSSCCLWTSQGSGLWIALGGRQVMLTDTTLLNLTDVETRALRQVALAKLQGVDLGCSVSVPKCSDESAMEKPKRRALLLKKRALTTGFFEHGNKNKEDSDETRRSGLVFGVPLVKCIKNDRTCHRSASAPLRDVANLMGTRLKAGSASAEDISSERLISSRGLAGSQTSCNIPLDMQRDERFFAKNKEGSYESLNWVCKSHSMSGLSILDGLQDWNGIESEGEVTPHIPDVINTCFKHLESYGLHRLGIFRVSSSKKRVRQLREDFDSGKEIQLNKEHCPHDVATLLKEFFRDLPEPLLTRELYPAFVGTQRIRNRRQQLDSLKYLVQLLPVANRDTLWALLKFLSKVASNAVDHREENGQWVAGNKMDANNLATLFGPNILHMAKSGLSQGSEFQVESTKRADERIEVIKVVRMMIENFKELFEVSASQLDETYHRLMRDDPEMLGRLLLARLPTQEMDLDADTGSSACSETASVSHMPIDISMEVAAPLVISVHAEGGTRSWERTLSQTESLPDDTLVMKQARDSNESLNAERRPERGGSLGREVYTKTESVASRLFRRRDKSAARGGGALADEDKEMQHRASLEDALGQKADEGNRWFRKKEKAGALNVNKKEAESSSKKVKKDKERCVKRDSGESDGSASSEHRSSSSSLKGKDGRSRSRPLMFQENAPGGPQTTISGSSQQQVSVVDIRKEHLHLPDVSERRLSSPDVESTVITASLTLKVPLSRSQTGPAIAFGQGRDTDIPFIEDHQSEQAEIRQAAAASRQRYLDKRHRSSPFFQKNSGSESTAAKTGTASKSGAAALAPVLAARQRSGSSEMAPLATSASASAIHGPRFSRRSRETTTNIAKTICPADDSRIVPGTWIVQTGEQSTGTMPRGGTSAPKVSSAAKSQPQRSQPAVGKPETGGSSTMTTTTTAATTSTTTRRSSGNVQWPQETWKRWEIIASEHTEQETVV